MGCCLLKLLIVGMAIKGNCADLELHLEHLQEAWNGHRLITFVLCVPDTSLLLISLLLFPFFCWKIEEHLGTLHFLHLSCLCTLSISILYILVSWLLPLPLMPASGFLATQFAFMASQHPVCPWHAIKSLLPLLFCLILVTIDILCPGSSLLQHICGIVTGLALRYKIFTFLRLSEPRRRALEKTRLLSYLSSLSFVRFVPARDREFILPHTGQTTRERLPVSNDELSQPTILTHTHWDMESNHWSYAGLRNTADTFLGPEELEEQLLRAGIQASLNEYNKQEAEAQGFPLQKSSVSALRLQQLERMGFPTGPAVLALAATGKVERAVSLLVEGDVGTDTMIASEKLEPERYPNTQMF
ncbi:hypothetical protein GDO86_001739 [Hymenochirus boettgeri]|uniref:Peptidase S54 rhomboid domain-containing protein n=1 Tax=Hymenochirus boettgeri TaxID=247094 RepID=A0A8T2KM87_9PIPI|nr:hypothetical protein GDO86_001739 [Hymenochirus boettgeri]